MGGLEISSDLKDTEKQVERLGKDSSDDEKAEVSGTGERVLALELPKEEERRILRKVDWRLVPVLSLLYLIAFVDRSNSMYLAQYFAVL
jgi:hypothetical protein